jgi:hypothetical protein
VGSECFVYWGFSAYFVYNIDSTMLIRRPMLAQCGTAAVLFGAGDIIAQQAVEGKGKEHDVSLRRALSDRLFMSTFTSSLLERPD